MAVRTLKAPNAVEGTRDRTEVADAVRRIIDDVRERGDVAVREHSARFDGWEPEHFRLDDDHVEELVGGLDDQVVTDIRYAQEQVRRFAEAQLDSMREFELETLPGVTLGQRHLPIAAAGAYIPGGRYPLLASAHMTVLTAKVAGVPRVVACTPPIDGEVPAATVAAAHLAGADEIHILGGVQAVAAMAVGTESMEPVHFLAGPGNAFVAEAKRQLFGDVGIDLVAGPTEILVVADDSADPFVVAVDLLSQAEHGPDSPAILVTTSEALGRQVLTHVDRLLPDMPTRDFAGPAWRDHGVVQIVDDVDEAYAVADTYAAEHVQILTVDPRRAIDQMRDYGAIFLGEGTCVSYGDKVIGTNHVLPTGGAARYTGGLWVGKYLKTVTYQQVTDEASSVELGEVCGRAARVERFEGHARSGDVRAAKYGGADLPWAPVAEGPPGVG